MANSKASMQFIGVSIVLEKRGLRGNLRRVGYVRKFTSREIRRKSLLGPPRIELTRHLPPSILLSSARGTLVIPNSLMALDQLSRRPFAQIPVTPPPLSLSLPHSRCRVLTPR